MKAMMKLTMMVCLLLIAVSVQAQFTGMQFHYETGTFKAGDQKVKRNSVSVQFETLNFDSLGTYYVNANFKYSMDDKATFAQLKMFRSFKIKPLNPVQLAVGHAGIVGINSFYYAGVHMPFRIGKVTFLPLLLYSYNKNAQSPDARFTSGYSTRLFKNKVSVFGFVDVWTMDRYTTERALNGKRIGAQMTPQIWYNINNHIAMGTKLDISINRYSIDESIDVLPTAGVRWIF